MKCKKCRHFYTVMVTKEGYNPFPCCHLWEDEGKRPEPLTQACFEPREKRRKIDFLRYYAVISHKNTEGGIPL